MFKKVFQYSGIFIIASMLSIACAKIHHSSEKQQRWSADKANEWYDKFPSLIGTNYVPASAINCVCVWREHTWLVMPDENGKFAGRVLGHGTPFKSKDGKWWWTVLYNANVPLLLKKDEIENKNLIFTAASNNRHGTTIVPLDVFTNEQRELIIRAKNPAYGTPGSDEVQKFEINTLKELIYLNNTTYRYA